MIKKLFIATFLFSLVEIILYIYGQSVEPSVATHISLAAVNGDTTEAIAVRAYSALQYTSLGVGLLFIFVCYRISVQKQTKKTHSKK